MMLALPVGLGSSGCSKEQPPVQQKVAQLDPLPAPAGLIADMFVPNPDAAWGKARAAVGGPALFLPGTAGGLAATMLGLPVAAGGEIDGGVPVVGAIVENPAGGQPHAALGLHVRAGDKLVDMVTKGEAARFVARIDDKTTMTLLEPKGGGQRPVVMGVLGNYLLVAQTSQELLDIGPYVARTLPGAKMPKDDVSLELPSTALAGPIAKGLRGSWDKLKPKEVPGGAQGASLPSPIGGMVEALIAILGDLDHARIAVNMDDKAARVRLVGTPKAGAGAKSVEAMTVGDPRRMLELPAETEVALSLRDSAAVRVSDAKNYAAAITRALGPETPPDDGRAIEAALVAMAEGRGDSFTAGLSLLPTGPAAYVRSEVSDGDKLGKALEDLTGLVKLPSVKAYLGEAAVDVSTGKAVVEGMGGDVRRVRLERKSKAETGKGKDKADKGKKAEAPADGSGAPSSIDVLYTLGKDALWLAAGYEAKGALKLVMDAPGKENLSGRAEMKAAIEAAGDHVAFVFVVDPIRFLSRQAGKAELGPSAPILFAVGKGGEGVGEGEPWMRLDVANLAIQEAMRRRGAL
ncbi:hypothetical protein [Polyangium aurulentum]|uniref:hypothetical protein n=1 Tax=Polyangium aurulentum TaxID=2567896 RepID=UPI0010ADAF56|nr:hypothetical protein [Polyangium aurulentum]UQA58983.1 hypothetical protein E8A73_000210 [Polyangium aurulentum]